MTIKGCYILCFYFPSMSIVCIEYPWQHYCAIIFILGTPGRRLQVSVYVYIWVKVYLSYSGTARAVQRNPVSKNTKQ